MTELERGTIEYIRGRADVIVDANDADVMPTPAELSLSRGSTDNWMPATWDGSVTVTDSAADSSIPAGKKRLSSAIRTADVVSIDDDFPYPAYTIKGRVTDTPEIPVFRVGTLYILGSASTTPLPSGEVIDGGTF